MHLGTRPPRAGPLALAAPQPPQGPSSSSSSSSSGSSSVSRNWGLVQKVSSRGERNGVISPATGPLRASQGPIQASPEVGWLPPELKPRTQRPWKRWMCQPPPAGLGPSTSGLREQIWTVLKWRRKSCSSILDSGRQSDPAQPPPLQGPSLPSTSRPYCDPPNHKVSQIPQILLPSTFQSTK